MKISRFFKKTLGTHSMQELARGEDLLEHMDRAGRAFKEASDAALKLKAEELRKRARSGVAADDLLVETFALVREASERTLGMRHFDVQMLGGVACTGGTSPR